MPHKMKTLALCLALAACTHPADVSRPLTEISDKNAKFTVLDTTAGFSVEVRYSRYQFFPESSAVLTACRSLVIARVNDEAKKRGREIDPIDEQNIRVSNGRNEITGRTSCRAFAEATFKH
ncbi:hypothetical protein BH10PSE15_BH10PSE15_04750 [soil metagenome]